MAETSNEKVKLYVVIALLIVAAFIAYSRFGPKRNGSARSKPAARGPVSSFEIPELPAWLADFSSPLTVDRAPYAPPSRDIFNPRDDAAPGNATTKETLESPAAEKRPEVPGSTLPQLSAVMMGASGGLAVIDGEMLRVGQTVGTYTIEQINRNYVILRQGANRLTLRIGDN